MKMVYAFYEILDSILHPQGVGNTIRKSATERYAPRDGFKMVLFGN
jgi:hypothetical protein